MERRSILVAKNIQRALANQPWKEYTAEGGRKYWYNTETKQSSWEMPEIYKTALAQSTPAPKPAAPYVQSPLLILSTDARQSPAICSWRNEHALVIPPAARPR